MEKFTTWDVCRIPSAPSRPFQLPTKSPPGINAPYLYVAHNLRLAHRAHEPVIDCTRSSYHFLLPDPAYVVIVLMLFSSRCFTMQSIPAAHVIHRIAHRTPFSRGHGVNRIPWCNVRQVCGNLSSGLPCGPELEVELCGWASILR